MGGRGIVGGSVGECGRVKLVAAGGGGGGGSRLCVALAEAANAAL